MTRGGIIDRLTINPSEILVHGWERKKDPRIIWTMMHVLRTGGSLPAVHAYKRSDGGFNLDGNFIDEEKSGRTVFDLVFDGGHNRVLASIIEESVLSVDLTDGVESRFAFPRYRPVVDSEFKRMRGAFRIYAGLHPEARDLPPPDIEYMQQRLDVVQAQLNL